MKSDFVSFQFHKAPIEEKSLFSTLSRVAKVLNREAKERQATGNRFLNLRKVNAQKELDQN